MENNSMKATTILTDIGIANVFQCGNEWGWTLNGSEGREASFEYAVKAIEEEVADAMQEHDAEEALLRSQAMDASMRAQNSRTWASPAYVRKAEAAEEAAWAALRTHCDAVKAYWDLRMPPKSTEVAQ